MVIVNTKFIKIGTLDFKYLIEVPRLACLFGSTRDIHHGKTELFLVFDEGPVYQRKGEKGSWLPVLDEEEQGQIRTMFSLAYIKKRVPRYKSTHLN